MPTKAQKNALCVAAMRLHERLHTSRSRKSEYERTITSTELEMKGLVKRLKKVKKEYTELRTFVVAAKAGWCAVFATGT